MRIMLAVIIALLIPLAFAWGQQDSLIIDSVYVDSGQTIVALSTYGVTFDTVSFYRLGLRCNPPLGGVSISGITYFPPLTQWDLRYDTLYSDFRIIGLLGMADMPGGDTSAPGIFTNGFRQMLWTLRINIAPGTPPQVVTIDTLNGLSFGNDPAFRRGYIIIRSVTGVDDGEQTPRAFMLNQNYPNPFNAQTTIDYFLPEKSQVRLDIYDILGREIGVIVNDKQKAGPHSVSFDASALSSGIYFYRLKAGKYKQTRHFSVTK
jgi:hypothetical protein